MTQSSRLIGSVQRAIDILNLFDSQSPELGTTEIARALGLHKSTTASLMHTLAANGYLAQNPNTRKYRLGFKLVELASVMLNHIEIRDVAHSCLQELRDKFDETTNLAILDDGQVVYVERLLCTRALGMRSEVGKRTPAHSTALGKAILSCRPLDQMQAFIAQYGLPPVTPRTITDPSRFLAELEHTRDRGYAIDDEENELGGRCIAAPVFDHTGEAVASVSLSVPVSRLPLTGIPAFGESVRETARSISRALGYLPRSF